MQPDPCAEFTKALRERGLTVAEVAKFVAAEFDLPPQSVVFAYGSLVEGLANDSSDIDLALVSDADDWSITAEHNRHFELRGVQGDLMALPRRALDGAVARLRELNARAANLRANALGLSYPERRMLHGAITSCIVLAPAGYPGALTDLRRDELAANAVARARYWIGNAQVDLAGMRAAGDWLSMIFVAQEILLQVADALLARASHTNPNPKWRARLLARIERGWQDKLLYSGTAATAAEALIDLQRAPQDLTPSSILRFVAGAVAAARAVLLDQPLDRLPPPPVAAIGEDLRPVLDFDIDVVRSGDALFLVRLGDGLSLPLSAPLARFIPLVDGRRAPNEIVAIAAEQCGYGSAAALAELFADARRAGFFLADPTVERRLGALLADRS